MSSNYTEMGRVPYRFWVDKAAFKVHTSVISNIFAAVVAVLFILVGGKTKYFRIDFLIPFHTKRNLKNIYKNLIVRLSKHAIPIQ
jgi:hypothetical protein